MHFKAPQTAPEWLCALILLAVALWLLNLLFTRWIPAAVRLCILWRYFIRAEAWQANPTVQPGDRLLFQGGSGWKMQTVINRASNGEIIVRHVGANATVTQTLPVERLYPYEEQIARILKAF